MITFDDLNIQLTHFLEKNNFKSRPDNEKKTFLGRHKVQLEFLRRMVPQQGFVKYVDRYHQYHLLICMKSFTIKD